MTQGVEGPHPPRPGVSCETYFADAYDFNPVNFDADQWARDIKATGATCGMFIAKHHDGFAMWDTKVSDYSIVKATAFGRDLLSEYVEAMRRHGLRVGVYFSIIEYDDERHLEL